jgi:hypothetical protein
MYAKQHYEASTRPLVHITPSVGDMVLVREHKGGKFLAPTLGPYEVVEIKGRLGSVVVVDTPLGLRDHHISHVTLY